MLMKGKDAKKTLSLVVALFLLQIINSKKLSASDASWLSLPSYKEERQRCGVERCYEKCPPGSCCSWSGYCGTGKQYCGREYCKTQCPFTPPGRPMPLYLHGQCGVQAGGRKCPTGLCCSEDGWCGATEYHCNQRCQSQCRNLTSSADENRYGDEPECGRQGCYKKCPPGSCCNVRGYCGTTKEYCGDQCKSQCPTPPPPPNAPEQCGRVVRGRKCPTGLCCSIWGYCGTTKYFCGKRWCQSQCRPPPPPPPERCGMQAEGKKCPTGLCCSSSGWCGTTERYCAKQWCQSQCKVSHKSTAETFLLHDVV